MLGSEQKYATFSSIDEFKEKSITEMFTIINITFRHWQIMMKNILVLFQSWSRVSGSKMPTPQRPTENDLS
jgi:hypothetical protein